MFRRVFLVACTILLLGAAPAGAQSYGDTGGNRTVTVDTAGEAAPAFDELARTGSNQTVAMAEAAIVLLGGGAMLLLVARRRRAQRDNTPA